MFDSDEGGGTGRPAVKKSLAVQLFNSNLGCSCEHDAAIDWKTDARGLFGLSTIS